MAGAASLADAVLRFFPGVPRRFTPGAVRLLRMQRRVDCSKSRRELGFQPTSMSEAVREAYEFFVRQGLIIKPTQPMPAPAPGMSAAVNLHTFRKSIDMTAGLATRRSNNAASRIGGRLALYRPCP